MTSHRSSSFTLLQSLAIEDSRDKPTYSVLLGQLFAFIGTNPDQAVRPCFLFVGFVIFICLSVLGLSCGMRDLVPRPGIEPGSPTLLPGSSSRWTTGDVPVHHVLLSS